jgi:hypothetical protein
MGIGFGLCLWMTVPGIVDASWFVADDANHPAPETLNTSTEETRDGRGVKLCISVSINSPGLGNLNDRQMNTHLRTLAFLLSNAVAKLSSVMSHALARSKLPSVDSIQSSFLEREAQIWLLRLLQFHPWQCRTLPELLLEFLLALQEADNAAGCRDNSSGQR